MPQLFAQVILPLSLHDSYTYSIPESMQNQIKPGQRVIVQFGKTRLYAALVFSVSKQKPDDIEVKEIRQILDEDAIVLPQNFKLWEWMAKYYCCTLGDVFRAALPTGLKLESKSKVFSTGLETDSEISEKEDWILRQIEQDVIYLSDLQKKLGTNFSYSALKSLLAKDLVFIEEKVYSKYKPKTESFVRFHAEIKSENILETKFSDLRKAKKQAALLTHFCHKTNAFSENQLPLIAKKELFEGTNFNSTLLNELCKKNILVQFQKQVSRIEGEEIAQVSINMLNRYQDEALTQIKSAFQTQQVALIHGITASGKTEIYIHLIDEILKLGRQALYLVPEIALTTQIIKRLKNVFGKKVGIYHSKMNSQERVEIWQKSAVFLPFADLGLLIVDEEHENSFKQFDPAPRYNARDMAVVMGFQNDAKVLLGSATPSFESYYNALRGKYALVNLLKRHADVEPPEIVVADVKRAYKRKQMRSRNCTKILKLH